MYSVNIKKGLYHDGDDYSHVYAGYPQTDFYDTPEGAVKSIVSAKIDFLDFLILIIMWVLIFASTIIRLGHAPGILFLILNLVLVLRKPSNGFLVLLLIWFMPTGLLFIWRPFVVSAAIATIGYVLHGTYFKYKAFFLNKMVWAVLAFVMFAGLGVIIAYGSETALRYYIEYVEGFLFVCMVFALINTKEELGRALKWLVIVAGMSFFISLCHYYLGPSSLLFAITEEARCIGFAVGKTTVDVGGVQIQRLMWPGNEPNYFGAQLIFPFAIGLGLYSASPKTRSKIFWIGFVALIGFAILGTYSRSSVIVGLIVLILFLIKRKLRALVPIFLVLVATYVIIMFIPGIWDRIMTIMPSITETGGSGRFELWRSAVMLWMSSPIFGHGMGEAHGHIGKVVHSGFLQVLAENGLVGELLYLSIIYLAFKYLQKSQKLYGSKTHPDVILAQMAQLGLIGICLNYLTITPQDPKFLWLGCSVGALFYVVNERSLAEEWPDYKTLP